MKNNSYKIVVLRLREVRQNTAGKVILSTGQVLLYPGKENEDDAHEVGVSILLSCKTSDTLMEWESTSARIITTRLDSIHQKITIIHCFFLNTDATEEGKTSFLQGNTKPDGQSVQERCSSSDGRLKC